MNCCLKPDSDSESRDALNKRIKELEQENSKLKNEKLCKNEENDWRENIDIFVLVGGFIIFSSVVFISYRESIAAKVKLPN